MPSAARIVGKRQRRVAGLAGQAEILEADAPQRERRRLGGGEALVADEQRRIAARGETTSTASSNRGSNPVR